MRGPRALLRADLRRIRRDPVLLALGVHPLVLALAVRLGAPRLGPALGDPDALLAVERAATLVLLLLTPMMFGFLGGLLLLDERDEGVLLAVTPTPLGKDGFLALRMVVPMAWSATAGLLILMLLAPELPLPMRVGLAVLGGLEAPLLTLFLGALAGDKVQGIALAKVGSVLIGVGALGALLVPPWRWLFVPSPHFWIAAWFLAPRPSPLLFPLALLAHLAALWLLLRLFRRRTG